MTGSAGIATLDPLAARIFADLAARTADAEGVSRPAYSSTESETLAYLEDTARAEGLVCWRDSGQNSWFSLPDDAAAERAVVVGSHVDSVPRGGNFDGLAGVAAGLLCLVRARRDGARFARPVHVLALRGEESAWFGPCYIGSKALLGRLSEAERHAPHKEDGETLDSHMAATGVAMDEVRRGAPLVDPARLAAYLEVHIEQGPHLVAEAAPAAIVSGIRGNFRHRRIRCIGEAGHSGAVPRASRRDPVLATADLLMRLEESWKAALHRGEDMVLTSGILGTDPATHAMSRIAGSVEFSLDIRSESAEVLDEMRAVLDRAMRAVEQARGVRFERDEELAAAPAWCAPELVAGLVAAAGRLGRHAPVMASGGGHDAAVFANAGVPAAMLFVRNRGGSHNPAEAMEIADLLEASAILDACLTHDDGQ